MYTSTSLPRASDKNRTYCIKGIQVHVKYDPESAVTAAHHSGYIALNRRGARLQHITYIAMNRTSRDWICMKTTDRFQTIAANLQQTIFWYRTRTLKNFW